MQTAQAILKRDPQYTEAKIFLESASNFGTSKNNKQTFSEFEGKAIKSMHTWLQHPLFFSAQAVHWINKR